MVIGAMRSPYSILRNIISFAAAAGILAILHEFGVKYAEQRGWYDNLPSRVEQFAIHLSSAVEPTWVKLAIAFIAGIAITLWTDKYIKKYTNLIGATSKLEQKNADRVLLRLRFSGRAEAPVSLFEENISSWFVYWSPSANSRTDSGMTLFSIPPSWVIFIVFDKSVTYRQLTVNFVGERTPTAQVRQTTDRSAVITIDGHMPSCEIEILSRV